MSCLSGLTLQALVSSKDVDKFGWTKAYLITDWFVESMSRQFLNYPDDEFEWMNSSIIKLTNTKK
jgi:hypothetical protein